MRVVIAPSGHPMHRKKRSNEIKTMDEYEKQLTNFIEMGENFTNEKDKASVTFAKEKLQQIKDVKEAQPPAENSVDEKAVMDSIPDFQAKRKSAKSRKS